MSKIYIASDHAGFELKGVLADFLEKKKYTVIDLGPHQLNPTDDYPDFVLPTAQKVANELGSFGIVIGMSGEGEAMAANRVKGARAAVYYGGPKDILVLSREHNDANVLSLGARFLRAGEAQEAALLWLNTPFSGENRHVRRLGKF